jgi:DsbC/DsbD-like thiol-disulfide interchange protein
VAIASNIRLAASLIITLASSFARSPQAQPQHARVELLALQSSLKPGSDLQLGVHFILEKGWHIYWINPGDSGQPPSFKWQLPTGFSAGAIQWPQPERMQSSPEVTDYGYHDEALFMVPIHPRQSIRGEQLRGLRVAVEVKWLVCREVCIPEHADLELSLPSAAMKGDPATAKLFSDAKKLLPGPMPRSWTVRAESRKDDFSLTIRAAKSITKAIFFPLDPGQIDNSAPQKLQPSHSGATLTLKKSDLLLKPITVLRGVLVIPGGSAYRIEAPVRQPIQ